MEIESALRPYIETVNTRLDHLLPSVDQEPSVLHEAMRYSCLAPGKRLRPALAMVCCEAAGGTSQTALDAACAIEMVHCFSLIHDDLPGIDNDDLRRGMPTCHVKFGEAVAILAGDALFARAFDVLANQKNSAIVNIITIQILTKAVGSLGLVGGETIDVLSEGKQVDERTLETIHLRKTASLIAASCEIGAVLGSQYTTQYGTVAEVRERLRTYGESIGLAFQIADDVLNETGTPEQLGKAAGSDRERQKATYPAIFGIEESRKKALALADDAIENVRGFARESFLIDLARYSVERLN